MKPLHRSFPFRAFGMAPGDTFPGTNFSLADLCVTQTGLDNTPTDPDMLSQLGLTAIMMQNLADSIDTYSVLSCYRSDSVNAAVGGADGSYHHLGLAWDLHPDHLSIDQFFSQIINSPFLNQLGEVFIKPSQNSIHLSLSTPEKTAFVGILDPSSGSYRQLTSDEYDHYKSVMDYQGGELVGTNETLAISFGSVVLLLALSFLAWEVYKKQPSRRLATA